jgi:predicted DNA-binding transcriptional regulator YafY
MAPPVPVGEAVLSVRPGAGHRLRRRALRVTEGGDWDEVVVPVYDPDMLAEQITGYGPTVRVESPAELRVAVIRRLTGAVEAHAGLQQVPAGQL